VLQSRGTVYHQYGGGGMDAMDCCTAMMCMNCLCGGCN